MGQQKMPTALFPSPSTAPEWMNIADAVSQRSEKCWLPFFPAYRHKAAGSCAEAGQEPQHHCSRALLIFLVYLFPFLDASCLCRLTADNKSHREGRKVAASEFVVSGPGTAVVLPAPTPSKWRKFRPYGSRSHIAESDLENGMPHNERDKGNLNTRIYFLSPLRP